MVDEEDKEKPGRVTLDKHLNERDRVIARLEIRIEKITEKIAKLHSQMADLHAKQEELIQHVKERLNRRR